MFFVFNGLRRAPRITSSNMTPSPCWREPISWVISWGSPSRGTKIARHFTTFTSFTTPVMPRRSMIDLDDYNIRTLAQLMWSASSNQVRISIGPTSTQLKSQLRSHISSYSDDSSDLKSESWTHSSNPHQPRSPHELRIHPNMRAQSLTTVGPPANHSCELGGSGDSHRHLVVLLLHLKYFSFSCC